MGAKASLIFNITVSHMEYTITTTIGNIVLTPNCYDHIYVKGTVVVRGKENNFNAHFFKWQNGTWNLGEEKEQDYQRLRQFWTSGTEAFRTKVLSEITPVISNWARAHSGILEETIKEEIRLGIQWRQDQIGEHNKAIIELNKEITLLDGGNRLPRYSKTNNYTFGQKPA